MSRNFTDPISQEWLDANKSRVAEVTANLMKAAVILDYFEEWGVGAAGLKMSIDLARAENSVDQMAFMAACIVYENDIRDENPDLTSDEEKG